MNNFTKYITSTKQILKDEGKTLSNLKSSIKSKQSENDIINLKIFKKEYENIKNINNFRLCIYSYIKNLNFKNIKHNNSSILNLFYDMSSPEFHSLKYKEFEISIEPFTRNFLMNKKHKMEIENLKLLKNKYKIDNLDINFGI